MDNADDINKNSPANWDFANINEFIHHLHAYLLWDEITAQGISESVQTRLNNLDIKSIIPVILAVALSQKPGKPNVESAWVKKQITRIVYELLSMEKKVEDCDRYEWILEVDLQWHILAANDFMVEHSGYSREELVWENMSLMNSGTHAQDFWHNFWTTIQAGKVWAWDICNKRKDGSLVWLWTLVIPKVDEQGKVVSFKVVRQDISVAHILQQEVRGELGKKTDPLTGLPNHAKCLEDFSVDKNRSVAILHINNMFDINSAFGRSTGDVIIKKVGKALKNFCEQHNMKVYKFEGTEFSIIFEAGVSEAYILEHYEQINRLKIYDGENRIHLSFSLWVALNEIHIVSLLRNGYLALRESKQKRKYVVYDEKNHTTKESEEFFKMRTLVREAFKEDLFDVFFQEIKENPCSIKKSKDRKFECLVRMWDSKEKTNLLSPLRFLPVVKTDGKDELLTTLVTEKACAFMSKNKAYFSINLTKEDLLSPGFAKRIHSQVHSHGIDPRRITFEILEEIENIDSKNILENIRTLKNLKFKIAIDDFWSGYSNFSRMLDIQPTSLKIDMRFVRGIDTDERHRKLVYSIVWLAHSYKMTVVAEGVETIEEQLTLESLWVDYSQGYLFSKPSPTI